METTKQVEIERCRFKPVCSSGYIRFSGGMLMWQDEKIPKSIGTCASTVEVDYLFVEAILLEHDSIFTRQGEGRQYGEVDK